MHGMRSELDLFLCVPLKAVGMAWHEPLRRNRQAVCEISAAIMALETLGLIGQWTDIGLETTGREGKPAAPCKCGSFHAPLGGSRAERQKQLPRMVRDVIG